MGRDRGRGKRGGRGGGRRSYIQNIDELKKREGGVDDDEENSEEEEEENSTEPPRAAAPDSVFNLRPSKSKVKNVDEDEDEDDEEEARPTLLSTIDRKANPNYVKKTEKMLKVSSLNEDDGVAVDPLAGMNRKEREAMEALRKKEEYMKKHLAGETEQARKDLERLALIKKKRAEDAAKREKAGRKPGMSAYGLPEQDDNNADEGDSSGSSSEDDGEGKKAKSIPAAPTGISEIAAKKKAAAAEIVTESTDSSELEVLKAMDIKKMNGDSLKDHLKARGLDLQGAKKDLIQRLIDFEKSRS